MKTKKIINETSRHNNVLFKAKEDYPKPSQPVSICKPSIGVHYPALVISHKVDSNKDSARLVFKIALTSKKSIDHVEEYETEGKRSFLYDEVVDALAEGDFSQSLVSEYCEVHFFVYEKDGKQYKNFKVDGILTEKEVEEMLTELSAKQKRNNRNRSLLEDEDDSYDEDISDDDDSSYDEEEDDNDDDNSYDEDASYDDEDDSYDEEDDDDLYEEEDDDDLYEDDDDR